MKHVKRIFAFALTFVMAFGFVLTAYAQEVATGNGGSATITIANAAKGETYKVYKIFDATADDKGNISYTGDIPTALSAYFTKDSAGTIRKNTEGYTDENKDAKDAELAAAVADYVKNLTSDAVAEAEGDGTALTFKGLKYGYYGVTTTQGAAVTVDSTTPDALIYDKNSKTITADKQVGDDSYSIGDRITYTATFNTGNYVGEGEDAKIVTKYEIKDTLPEFLSNVTVESIKVGGTDITTQQFDANKTITIPWATGNNKDGYQSIYNNGAQIVIIYKATLTSVANINTANTNTVSIHPTVWNPDNKQEEEPWDDRWQHDAVIKTYAAALKKTDGTNHPLTGAQFKIKGLTVTGENGVYTVVNYDPDGADSEALSTNSEGKLYIIGLADDVQLTVTEFVAPDGYNKLTGSVTLTPQLMATKIYKESGTIHYDPKGNVVSQESNAKVHETVTANLTDLDENALQVENNKGTELPSTGGIGTTIFYIVGGVMVAGAVIFLLTKRRVNAE